MARTWTQYMSRETHALPFFPESRSLSVAFLYPNLPPSPSHFQSSSSVFIIQFLYRFFSLPCGSGKFRKWKREKEDQCRLASAIRLNSKGI